MQELLVKREQVADRLQVCLETVRKLARSGELTPVRIGRRGVRYRSSDVDRIVAHGAVSGSDRQA